MKIGIYCTNNYSYPLASGLIYANMDVAVSLADGLADLGEEVTLFAAVGTQTKAKLVTFEMLPFSDSTVTAAYSHSGSSYQYENLMMMKALNYMEENGFDIFQTHCRPFSVINFAPLKPKLATVVTVHDPLSDAAYKILPLYQDFKNLHWVSLSLAQRKTGPVVKWTGNAYNGVDLKTFQFNPKKGEYLFFSGRIMPEKGVDLAVQAALKTGLQLKIVGSIYPEMERFFNGKIKPYLGEQIEYLGVLPKRETVKYYQNAKALLMPIRWPEPFGLVVTESMACGTPVIAWNRGAMPEIIEDGVSGYLVNSMEEMVKRIGEVDKLSRAAARKRVEEKFSVEKMVGRYVELYKTLI